MDLYKLKTKDNHKPDYPMEFFDERPAERAEMSHNLDFFWFQATAVSWLL